MDSRLRQRIITALLFGVLVMVPLIVGQIPAMIMLGLLGLMTSLEYLQLLGEQGWKQKLLVLMGAGLFLSFAGYVLNPDSLTGLRGAIYLGSIFALYLATSYALRRDPLSLKFRLLYPLYTMLPFALLFAYCLWFGTYHSGLVVLIVSLIWINDVMAYFVGKTWGRHQLAPAVSPKKTWEGTFGGWLSTAALATLAGRWLPEFALWQLVVLGLVIATSSTLGDLIESRFKRTQNIKDSGSMLPGHGGFLDRLDSLLFCVPLVGLYLLLIKPI